MRWRAGFNLILGALLGLASGYFLFGTKQSITTDTPTQPIERIQSLAETELKEYLKLKESADRYRRAEELLAKVWLILLADLGIRMDPKAIHQIKERVNKAAKSVEVSVETHSSPGTETTEEAATEEERKPPRETSGALESWVENEYYSADARTFKGERKFLDTVAIKEFGKALLSSKIASHPQRFAPFVGSFRGKVHLFGKKKEIWRIKLDIDAELVNSKGPSGNMRLVLIKDGEVFSNSKGRGDLRSFRQFSNDSKALLVQASSNIYFQLYDLKSEGRLIGNTYRQNEPGQFKLIGTAHLRRITPSQ